MFLAASALLLLCLFLQVPSGNAASSPSISTHTPSNLAQATVVSTPGADDPTMTALQDAQLRLQIQNSQYTLLNWLWNNTATLILLLVASLGGARWLWEQSATREREVDNDFHAAIKDLSSQDLQKKTGSALILRTFLQHKYKRFYIQVFELATTHLCTRHPSPPGPERLANEELFKQALVNLFREAFPRAREMARRQEKPFLSSSLDAAHIQLRGTDLSGADLKGAWIPSSALQQANLRSADLSKANLSKADLTEARLTNATLAEANLAQAILTEATLERAELPGAILDDATLHHTNLTRANLTKAVLLRADLTNAVLQRAELPGAILERGLLVGTNLVEANLTRALLIQTDFTNAHLDGADLTEADLSGANPEQAHSLLGTKMARTKNLSPTSRRICEERGALF